MGMQRHRLPRAAVAGIRCTRHRSHCRGQELGGRHRHQPGSRTGRDPLGQRDRPDTCHGIRAGLLREGHRPRGRSGLLPRYRHSPRWVWRDHRSPGAYLPRHRVGHHRRRNWWPFHAASDRPGADPTCCVARCPGGAVHYASAGAGGSRSAGCHNRYSERPATDVNGIRQAERDLDQPRGRRFGTAFRRSPRSWRSHGHPCSRRTVVVATWCSCTGVPIHVPG